MKKVLMVCFLLAAALGFGGMAPAADEEADLNQAAAEINRMPYAPESLPARIEELAKRFNVPESRVADLRNNKNMGWGKIAKETGFKLGPVVSSVQRGKASLHVADRKSAGRFERRRELGRPQRPEPRGP